MNNSKIISYMNISKVKKDGMCHIFCLLYFNFVNFVLDYSIYIISTSLSSPIHSMFPLVSLKYSLFIIIIIITYEREREKPELIQLFSYPGCHVNCIVFIQILFRCHVIGISWIQILYNVYKTLYSRKDTGSVAPNTFSSIFYNPF